MIEVGGGGGGNCISVLLCTPTEETELCVSAKVVLVSPHCVPYFIHERRPIQNQRSRPNISMKICQGVYKNDI